MSDIGKLDGDLRRILEHLADEVLPLTRWINDAKPYTPPGVLPWRDGAGPWSLTVRELGFLRFFEGLLAETSGDIDLVARFERVSREPLARSPIPDVETWRSARGLSKEARFDIGDSRNMPVDDNHQLYSRARFYAEFWPLLRAAVGQAEADAMAAGKAVDWALLTAELLTDRCKSWPSWQPRVSSTFMNQLRRDVLYAVLGTRNPAPIPWRYAVLIELGQHRRPPISSARASKAWAGNPRRCHAPWYLREGPRTRHARPSRPRFERGAPSRRPRSGNKAPRASGRIGSARRATCADTAENTCAGARRDRNRAPE